MPRAELARCCRAAAAAFLAESERRGVTAHRRRPWLVIESKHRVRQLLERRCLAAGQQLLLLRGAPRRGLTFALRGFEQERELLGLSCVSDLGGALPAGRRCSFGFAGPTLLNVFQARVVRAEADQLWVTFPERILQVNQRRSPRFSLPADSEARVTLYHPWLPELVLEKPLHDVSAEGFAIPLVPAQDLLLPGMIIPRVELSTAGGTVRVRARVRHISSSHTRPGLICGLELVGPLSSKQAQAWAAQVLQLGHPRLELATSQQVPEAWQVLEDSGYLAETPASLADQLSQGFHGSWRRYAGKPQIGRLLLLRSGKKAVATVAITLCYPRSWIIHHLGVDKQVRKQDRGGFMRLVQELYSGVFFALQHLTVMEYYVSYVNATRHWTGLMYGRFLERYAQPGDFLYQRFQLYKGASGPPLSAGAEAPRELEVLQATTALLSSLAAALARRLPQIEREACCYGPEEIALGAFRQRCLALGYERERVIYVVRRRGQQTPLAALVAETGQEGANIFSLLDSCWIFALETDAALQASLLALLLRQAQAFYAARGKRQFVYLVPVEPGRACQRQIEALGFHYQADVFRWIARRRLIVAYLNYVRELVELGDG